MKETINKGNSLDYRALQMLSKSIGNDEGFLLDSFLKVKMASMIVYNSQEFYDQLIDEINHAQKSIEIEVYIWEVGAIGAKIEEALLAALNRGVNVRIIIDRIGSLDWIMKQMDGLVAKGLDIRIFRPPLKLTNWMRDMHRAIPVILSMLNRRNHRKVYIVDDTVSYIGSQNIMDQAIEWKEAMIRLENKDDIRLLKNIFDSTWKWIKSDSQRFRNADFTNIITGVQSSPTIRTTQTKKLRQLFRKEFCRLIEASQNRVWLVTPYFNPPRYFLQSIVNAARKGVDVRLIVPRINDVPWYNYLSRLYYGPLLKRGIRIFEYEKSVLHAKTALIDDLGTVGSANLNYRSFYQDLEMNVLISDKKLISQMEEEFLHDLECCVEILSKNRLSLWERAFGSFLTLFKTSF